MSTRNFTSMVLLQEEEEDNYGFPHPKEHFMEMVDPKKPQLLQDMGGVAGVAEDLKSSLKKGLSVEDNFVARERCYGKNVIPPRKATSFFKLILAALDDRMLQVLCVAAVVSGVLGVLTAPDGKKETGWIEGGAILLAVVIVVLVTAVNDFQKEKQFRALNAKKDDKQFSVIRSGSKVQIPVHEIVVGDLLLIETGHILPVDGLYVDGSNLKCDESSATGESDAIKKGLSDNLDPFILSGSRAIEGQGKCLVIGVGEYSYYGKIMMSLIEEEEEETPLQEKLTKLADDIGKAGAIAAGLLVISLIAKLLIVTLAIDGKEFNTLVNLETLESLVGYIIVAVTIIVVAVPEGLPLAVTIALAYSMLKMLKDKNLVRHLSACETMGGATNICTDKTGTLTQNQMTVVAGWIAGNEYDNSDSNWDLNKDILKTLMKGICINTTAYRAVGKEGQKIWLGGGETEAALLQFSELFGFSYEKERNTHETVFTIPFSSSRKRMSTIVKTDSGKYRMYVKGASEIVVSTCTSFITEDGNVQPLEEKDIQDAKEKINEMAKDALRTLSLSYKEFDEELDWENIGEEELEKDLILLGFVGIRDPLRLEVIDAVRDCQAAGITVRMVTGDNIVTAENIAKKCGILTNRGETIEGPDFRKLSQSEMDKLLPRLQVIARSSPGDKKLLVKQLKRLNEVVAVTGDGTNDAPALKLAHVGFAMGIAGTDVAKEASDIIIMDDNFASIVKAVLWGRNVYGSIRKFIQFQVTVNIVAVIVAFVGAVSDPKGESPLNPVQLLWVNLIMDTFAALALATDPPTPDLLDRAPYAKNEGLISRTMWKNILGQSIYQLIVSFITLYEPSWFGIDPSTENGNIMHKTLIFNNFVLMQLFNELNARKTTDKDKNILKGIFSNYIFLAILFFTLVFQIVLVTFGGVVVETVPLDLIHWGWGLGFGVLSLPIGLFLKFIPIPEPVLPMLPILEDDEDEDDDEDLALRVLPKYD